MGKLAPGCFRTRVIRNGVNPSLHIEYKRVILKQYFKEGRGLRTEATFRNTLDFGIHKGLSNLPYLQQVGRHINRRLLQVERVSQNCGLSADSIQRVVQPTVTEAARNGWRMWLTMTETLLRFMSLPLRLERQAQVRATRSRREGDGTEVAWRRQGTFYLSQPKR